MRARSKLKWSGLYGTDLGGRLCRFLADSESWPIVTFYPSSVAAEDFPLAMTEYSMAKSAGETLCPYLNSSECCVRVLVSRRTRLLTDQTATVNPGIR
jgi:hypothetical protein